MSRSTDKRASPATRRPKAKLNTQKPRGREAVMAATIKAATRLFTIRGPASVSIRDIATAAGVNHALVHRHFGSKNRVLKLVLKQAVDGAGAIAESIRTLDGNGMEQLFTAATERAYYWQALARAILDGEAVKEIQTEFPTVRRMVNLLRGERQQGFDQVSRDNVDLVEVDERTIVGTVIALMLGWLLFEPYLLAATGLSKSDRKSSRRHVSQVMAVIIDAARKTSTNGLAARMDLNTRHERA